jgi:hypothetical protein
MHRSFAKQYHKYQCQQQNYERNARPANGFFEHSLDLISVASSPDDMTFREKFSQHKCTCYRPSDKGKCSQEENFEKGNVGNLHQ